MRPRFLGHQSGSKPPSRAERLWLERLVAGLRSSQALNVSAPPFEYEAQLELLAHINVYWKEKSSRFSQTRFVLKASQLLVWLEALPFVSRPCDGKFLNFSQSHLRGGEANAKVVAGAGDVPRGTADRVPG